MNHRLGQHKEVGGGPGNRQQVQAPLLREKAGEGNEQPGQADEEQQVQERYANYRVCSV